MPSVDDFPMMIMEIGSNKIYTKLISAKHDERTSALDTLQAFIFIVRRVILVGLLNAKRTEQHESISVNEIGGFNYISGILDVSETQNPTLFTSEGN